MEPICLPALGRCVQVGDLYDYYTDRILSSKFTFNNFVLLNANHHLIDHQVESQYLSIVYRRSTNRIRKRNDFSLLIN